MAFLQLRNAQNVAEGMSHYVYLGVVCGLQLQKSTETSVDLFEVDDVFNSVRFIQQK